MIVARPQRRHSWTWSRRKNAQRCRREGCGLRRRVHLRKARKRGFGRVHVWKYLLEGNWREWARGAPPCHG